MVCLNIGLAGLGDVSKNTGPVYSAMAYMSGAGNSTKTAVRTGGRPSAPHWATIGDKHHIGTTQQYLADHNLYAQADNSRIGTVPLLWRHHYALDHFLSPNNYV